MVNLITIELNNLRFFAHHGLHANERKIGNEFKADLRVIFEPPHQSITAINESIDYEQLFGLVKEEMKKPGRSSGNFSNEYYIRHTQFIFAGKRG